MDIVTLFVLCVAVGGLAGIVIEILHHDAGIIFELGDVQAFATAEPPAAVEKVAPAPAREAIAEPA